MNLLRKGHVGTEPVLNVKVVLALNLPVVNVKVVLALNLSVM